MIRIASVVLLLITVGLGCAKPYVANGFEGGDRPDAELAQLKLDWDVRFISLDGKPVVGIPVQFAGTSGDSASPPRIIRLLPGTHRLIVGCGPHQSKGHSTGGGGGVAITWNPEINYPGSRENEQIEFTAVAGRRYGLEIKNPPDFFSKQERWRAVVNDTTGPEFAHEVSRSLGRIAHDFEKYLPPR